MLTTPHHNAIRIISNAKKSLFMIDGDHVPVYFDGTAGPTDADILPIYGKIILNSESKFVALCRVQPIRLIRVAPFYLHLLTDKT